VSVERQTKPAAGRPASGAKLGAAGFAELSEAVESGEGLPALARAAARVLGASVAVIDRVGAVLAVASASAGEEERLLGGGEGVRTIELRVADAVVGELRYRAGKAEPDPTIARTVSTLLALEVERARSPEWESGRLAADFVDAVLARDVTDGDDLVARGGELGAELGTGAGVVIARAVPHAAQPEEWRERVLMLAVRALRGAARGSLASRRGSDAAEVAAIAPAVDDAALERAAGALQRELEASLPGFTITVARSRWTREPAELYRAGKEAKLAANVGEAEGRSPLAFEDTGSYRLLLPAMSEDPRELERFYEETVAPLAAYDDQYETELMATVEAYLDSDGNVTPTAERLFTHRHTVRYRLERVRELSGHDMFSTEGREKLGLGLKAMRVLGIAAPSGPATEPGAGAGRVRRPSED
jgi:PucR family transcriptional regulator, purine catabolism regulatory protein